MPTQVKDPERELRLSLQNLEPKALDQFFERYFNSIYSRVFSQVRNRQDAEDLTQDVLLKLQRAFPSLDPSRQLDPWVNTILKNRVLDHWRHRGAKRDSVSYDDPDSTLHLQPVTDGSPFDEQ